MNIIEELFKNQDLKYKEFSARLTPNVDKEYIIGVRIPVLRKIAKTLNEEEKRQVLDSLPHKYQEEVLLHRFVIESIKDYDQMLIELNKLLPYMNNWQHTDGFTNKTIEKHKDEFEKVLENWFKSKHLYTKRFALDVHMHYYLDEDFKKEYLDNIVAIDHQNEYYLQMMIAWYFATSLAKQYKSTIPYLEKQCLDSFTHNKAIQKARESYRITKEQKDYLLTLKIPHSV